MALESARERELHRYYQPWLDTFLSSQRQLDKTEARPPLRTDGHRPHSSRDKALTAFAQLGCLRLNAKRGIVTLVDSRKQYIIAEATKSLSLLDDSGFVEGDELWFGNSFIARSHGISPDALNPLTVTVHSQDGSSSYSAPALIISDVSIDPRYSSREYAGSGVSFYVGVPITTKSGHVIGVYNVTDDKPRDGISPDELRFMVDMANIVIQHLEVVKNDRARYRGERLIHGIGNFIEGTTPPLSDRPSDHQPPPDKAASGYFDDRPTSDGNTGGTSPGDLASPTTFKGLIIGDANSPSHEELQTPSQAPTTSEAPDLQHAKQPNSKLGSSTPPNNKRRNHISGTGTKRWSKQQASRELATLEYSRVFDRAAVALRHCMNADGVVFLNASVANLSSGSSGKTSGGAVTIQHSTNKHGRPVYPEEDVSTQGQDRRRNRAASGSASHHSDESVLSSSSSELDTSESSGSKNNAKRQICEILGSSVPDRLDPIKVPEATLRRFVRRHPTGKSFSFDEFGRPLASDDSSESASNVLEPLDDDEEAGPQAAQSAATLPTKNALHKAFRGARDMVFYPLWDFAKNRWHSAVVVWSNNAGALTNVQEDMLYLKAFNNAVMNEVHRINLILSNKAKATFLANISHELRSPLHGILGSIEFLHDTVMDDFQAGMVISVETCGKTLLDTVNHVLDHAKINNLSKNANRHLGHASNRGTEQASNSESSLTEEFDVATVIEEAVEAIYAGQVFRSANADRIDGKKEPMSAAARAMRDRDEVRSDIRQSSASNKSVAVRLTLNILESSNWNVRSQPGALRRIVMNILGNALKYTVQGSINVDLTIDGTRKKSSDILHLVLTVTDTGRGMSEEFVRNHAFTAFSQEDSLASGTGLGLSIVRQIVDSLGGKIHLSSQKDVGTEFKIWLSLPRGHRNPSAVEETRILRQMQKQVKGLNLAMIEPDYITVHKGDKDVHFEMSPKMTVEGSMKALAGEWFKMNVTTVGSMQDQAPDFFMYPEPPPIDFLLDYHGNTGTDRAIPVIILCMNAFEAASLRANGIHKLTDIGRIIEVIAQPCGPQKLAKVLHRSMQRMKMLSDPAIRAGSSHIPLTTNRTEALRKFREPPADDEPKGVPPSPPPHISTNRDLTMQQRSESAKQNSSSTPETDDQAQEENKPSMADDPKSQSSRVLVVDDNKINLHLLEAFVLRTNHPHESASDGAQALEAYKRSATEKGGAERFKHILMDISMPVMDGITSAQEIRRFEKDHQIEPPVKIIALTGLGQEDAQGDASRAKFDMWLSKPVKFRDLQRLLENGLRPSDGVDQ
ncbi:hypothetical protein PV10_02609 [Exophiala mesophila]|uniref:histidine kinase n=1 Tax=Exophiala mesophila TaxID=212818 RepID=A0A0D2A7B9_EXOME|nr:uncharacterized protein PV10_02609 [Exophiala mesophila]KIV94888.1 hypothetical protein PV10_02609 [Exophiala mesophila]